MINSSTSPNNNPIWYGGVCDLILARLQVWSKFYEHGEVSATRQFLAKDGRLLDKPTQYAHKIPWRAEELDHLIRIVGAYQPSGPLLQELQKIRKIWKNGLLRPGGYRVLTLLFYPEHIREMVDLMLRCKTGMARQTLDQILEERKQEGKDLFEV